MNCPKTTPVVAIWIDAGDIDLVKQWMSEGRLKHFRQLADSGLFAELDGFEHSRAEIMQCVSITGCRPETSGYWCQHWYDPNSYQYSQRGAYGYERRPPYFALGNEYQVAVLDLPQYRFHPDVAGWQMAGWGSHHPMTKLWSVPAELADDIIARYGEHPIRQTEYANLDDAKSMGRLFAALKNGIRRRTSMIVDLASRRSWDLFLTLFAEVHTGGHYFYPHPGNLWFLGKKDPLRYLRTLYVEVDRAVGKIHSALQDSYRLALFSFEGISVSSDEVKSIFLLPEIMARHSFGGSGFFEFDEQKRTPSPESQAGIRDWTMEAWNLRRRPCDAAERLRSKLTPAEAVAVERSMNLSPAPFHPSNFDYLPYQPALWISPYWPYMKAFALPSFTDGAIRINLEGRESRGRVRLEEYEQTCREISGVLSSFHHPDSGKPMVKEIRRTRENPLRDDLSLPYGDLIVTWEDEADTRFVSPELGSIGPVPPLRAGSHPSTGFFMTSGENVPADARRPTGHVLDIAPTILSLMNVEPPAHLDGQPLLSPTFQHAAA